MKLEVELLEYADKSRERDKNDRWDRGDTYTTLDSVVVRKSSTGSYDLDVSVGQSVYVVINRYSTGDTFGNDYGVSNVLDVFATSFEANELVSKIDGINSLVVLHNKKYYVNGVDDYFGRWSTCFSWECIVRE